MKKVELNKKKKQDALLNTAYQLFTEKGFQKTSISDIECEYEEQDGFFWHINYPLADGSGFVEIATCLLYTSPRPRDA